MRQCDIVIVCALFDPELTAVLRTGASDGVHWREVGGGLHDVQIYHHSYWHASPGTKLSVIAAAATQMGMSAAASLTTKLILRCRPSLVVMPGIAAGVSSAKQQYGDILAPEQTFDYTAGKVSSIDEKAIFQPDPKPLPVRRELVARLREWEKKRALLAPISDAWSAPKPAKALSLRVGTLGSGTAVIDHRKVVSDVLSDFRKLIGVEMEAYGVHRACEDTVAGGVPMLCAKSICDFAQNKSDRWQGYAAFSSAEFCYRFILAEWSRLRLPPAARRPRLPGSQAPRSGGQPSGDGQRLFLQRVRREFPLRTFAEISQAMGKHPGIDDFVRAMSGPDDDKGRHERFSSECRRLYARARGAE